MSDEKFKLKAREIYGQMYLFPACTKSEAFSQILQTGPRAMISPNEVHLLTKMGLDVEIIGDAKEFKKEIKRLEKL